MTGILIVQIFHKNAMQTSRKFFLLFLSCRFGVRYILSDQSQIDWNGEAGRMNDEIATSLFKSDSEFYSEYCLVCGPLPFNDLCEKTLRQAGYQDDCLHYFRG